MFNLQGGDIWRGRHSLVSASAKLTSQVPSDNTQSSTTYVASFSISAAPSSDMSSSDSSPTTSSTSSSSTDSTLVIALSLCLSTVFVLGVAGGVYYCYILNRASASTKSDDPVKHADEACVKNPISTQQSRDIELSNI